MDSRADRRRGFFQRATAREDAGDVKGAIDYYTMSIDIEPTVDAHFNRARLYGGLGKKLEQIADLGKVLAIDPSDNEARSVLEQFQEFYEVGVSQPKLAKKFRDDPKRMLAACREALAQGNG